MSETTQTVEDKLAALQEALERKRAIVGEAHAVKAPAKGPTVPDDEGEASPDRPGSENAASERSASVAEPNQPPLHIPDTRNLKGRSNTLPNGLTVKQEAFARLCAIGHNQSDAYREAYQTGGTNETIHAAASKLANSDKVATRIAAIQTQLERDKQRVALRDRERWYHRAWAEAEGLDKDNKPVVTTPASRVAALGQLGKALKITENQPEEQDQRDASAIAEEIAERLHALRAGTSLPTPDA